MRYAGWRARAGQRCVAAERPARVCQLEEELHQLATSLPNLTDPTATDEDTVLRALDDLAALHG